MHKLSACQFIFLPGKEYKAVTSNRSSGAAHQMKVLNNRIMIMGMNQCYRLYLHQSDGIPRQPPPPPKANPIYTGFLESWPLTRSVYVRRRSTLCANSGSIMCPESTARITKVVVVNFYLSPIQFTLYKSSIHFILI